MNFARLKLHRCAARVVRCHTSHVNHRQTVGEHTFGLLCILFEIADRQDTFDIVQYALDHDVPEAIEGDTPSPVKWRHPNLHKALHEAEASIQKEFDLTADTHLSVRQQQIFRYCDIMEFVMFAIEEVDSGNILMATQMRNAIRSLEREKLENITASAYALYQAIRTKIDTYHPNIGEDTLNGWSGYFKGGT
jgi:5'-deoxynucleotidase YfbR-like HD superfamily hydrolase